MYPNDLTKRIPATKVDVPIARLLLATETVEDTHLMLPDRCSFANTSFFKKREKKLVGSSRPLLGTPR